MLRLISDENFNGEIIRGLLRLDPAIDLVRVQDAGLSGADDITLLDWAAGEERIVLMHDQATMPAFAYERLRQDAPMAGVFVMSNRLPVGQAIKEIVLLAECSEKDDWRGMVIWLPL